VTLPPAASRIPDDRVADRLAARGQRELALWTPALAEADRDGRVSGPARLLCCGLAELAHAMARATGVADPSAATHAAAGLALLTKLDDEFIDAPDFHGGPSADRAVLRARTEAFLAPTLVAMHAGVAPPGAPARAQLAALVGRALMDCSADSGTLQRLQDLIRRGWAIQVDAVATLSARPGAVPLAQVVETTAAISGAWLAMITSTGGLPAGRPLTADEEAAFFAWGRAIQAADALADLDKDLADSFAATLPLCIATRRDPTLLVRWSAGDAAGLRRGLVHTGADLAVLPDPAALDHLDRRLARLGDVPRLLRWIHGFLLGRYLAATPFADRAAFAPYISDWAAFAPSHAPEAPCSG